MKKIYLLSSLILILNFLIACEENSEKVVSSEIKTYENPPSMTIDQNKDYQAVFYLKKGGTFIGSTPQVETKNPLKIMAMKKIDPFHLHLYSIKMLNTLLSKYFNNVVIESQPEEWMLFKCTK